MDSFKAVYRILAVLEGTNKPDELLAYSMELHVMKKNNRLSEEIVRLFLERIK